MLTDPSGRPHTDSAWRAWWQRNGQAVMALVRRPGQLDALVWDEDAGVWRRSAGGVQQ
jgi:hypothetical protein